MDDITSLEFLLARNDRLVFAAALAALLGLAIQHGPRLFLGQAASISRVGTVVLALAIAGELTLHFRSSEIINRIRELQRESDETRLQAIADITKQLADANERAATAEQKAVLAVAETENANELAARANAKTAKLRLALETAVGAHESRSLTAEQRSMIVDQLTKAPKGKLYVIGSPFDQESNLFAQQISSVLRDAGFEVSDMPPQRNRPVGFDRPGAWIWVHALTDPVAQHARPIQDAFKRAGWYLAGQEHPDLLEAGEVLVAISSYP
jgi:hypothetical protein